jgi:hypothetical protein
VQLVVAHAVPSAGSARVCGSAALGVPAFAGASRRRRSIARLRAMIHRAGLEDESGARPPLHRRDERVLHRVLGDRGIAEGADLNNDLRPSDLVR